MDWDSLDWAALDRLRDAFLRGASAGAASYWTSRADLASYDFSFGRRIGWKWDAVLGELRRRHWQPACRQVLDWGCGSGVAGRRVLEWFGTERLDTLRLFDCSSLAADFARESAQAAFPRATVECVHQAWLEQAESVGLLVVSHVLNELTPGHRQQLLQLPARAEAVLWVEPGTFADSHALLAVRDELARQFNVIAPCTHQAGCGLLAAGNERHWCHHFAAPPAGIMADARWVRFAQRAGIDLRRLPYSYLVLERKTEPGQAPPVEAGCLSVAGCSRVLGAPRLYKGYAKVLSCQADGVRDLMLQKRDAPEVFKRMKAGKHAGVYRWERAGDRIQRATALGETKDRPSDD